MLDTICIFFILAPIFFSPSLFAGLCSALHRRAEDICIMDVRGLRWSRLSSCSWSGSAERVRLLTRRRQMGAGAMLIACFWAVRPMPATT